ncbi:MAG: DnaJ family molecular chaperone [Hyphomicrobiaceae bacterium]
MFERNKIDNVDQTAVPVELTTDDGETLKGKLLIAMGRNVFEVLNGTGTFLEFEPYGGERAFIAKAAIRNLKLVNVPRAPSLNARLRDQDGFEPHMILGVPSHSSFDDVKAAWHRLSKAYHPDRYQSVELPQEVRDYLSAMSRRINLAYASIEAPHQVKKQAQQARATPIYTSGQRTTPAA